LHGLGFGGEWATGAVLMGEVKPLGRRSPGVRHFLYRVCRAADRRGDIRPLGRSDRAQGPSPFIATALFAAFASSLPIAFYILGCVVIGYCRDSAADGLHQ
jgi:hypothetical protein